MNPPPVYGLGIETSCDETGVAVVRDGRHILSNIIYSQIPEHAPFRGVVPEIASRSHLEKINDVYEQAIAESGISPEDLSYVAVTNRPGLLGSLMMGGVLAKSISLVHNVPLIPVDHLESHLYAVRLNGIEIEYPFLGLLLSGGNSAIYRVTAPGEMNRLVDTMDDAAGEAFDKAAAVLQLPYPGGPHIEKLASEYNPEGVKGGSLFPRLLKNRPDSDLAFSFSGIKTAVLRAAQEKKDTLQICYDFQNTVFELIERILLRAVSQTGIDRVITSGGVLANYTLRTRLEALAEKSGFSIFIPSDRILCTDNGAMTAALGYDYYLLNSFEGLDFPVSSRVL